MLHVRIIILLSTAILANSCRLVLIIHGLMEPAERLEPLAEQIRKAPDCPSGRNVTLFTINEGLISFLPLWMQASHYQKAMTPYFKDYPDGIHVIGFSQGSLISRTVLQLTDDHNVRSLISLCGVQMGNSRWPAGKTDFFYFDPITAKIITSILWLFCYNVIGQHLTSVCNYWRDEKHLELYLKENDFLPVINNEVPHINTEKFKRNLVAINKFILVVTTGDIVVVPYQSGHFATHVVNGSIIPMEDQQIYKTDSLGLKTLIERGDLLRFTVSGIKHGQVPLDPDVIDKFILPYLD